VIDKYFGLEFESETKCVETEDEPPTVTTERFLQYNCYIDKDVKYLATGLSNVSFETSFAISKKMFKTVWDN
jgi:ubiquitin carboxyl-terminal hydrolase 14